MNQNTAGGALQIDSSFRRAYSTSSGAFTPPATPTDMATITGSASATIRVIRARLSTTQTVAGINIFHLIKRSTANSGGTSSALTAIPNDSSAVAASATCLSYTANPTLGSAVGTLSRLNLLSPALASVINSLQTYEFGPSGIVLRGITQVLAFSFAGAALPTGLSINVDFDWTEE